MNLDQSQFSNDHDAIDVEGVEGILVTGNIDALDGDDRIIYQSTSTTPPEFGILIDKGSTLSGGLGLNYLKSHAYADDDSYPVGYFARFAIAVRGLLQGFQTIVAQGLQGLFVDNDSSIRLSRVQQGFSAIFARAESYSGLENVGKIFVSDGSQVKITADSSLGIGLVNSGTIKFGPSNDAIFTNSLQNDGLIDLGSGDDSLRINRGYYTPSNFSNEVLGSGQIKLGKGQDRLIFGGVVKRGGYAAGRIGTVSGGAGKQDRLVIEEGQFRFSKLSGNRYRIFDANDVVVADVDGFEIIETPDGVNKIGEGTFGQLPNDGQSTLL